MNIRNMSEELFVRAPEETDPISDAEADRLRNNVLSARDIGTAMKVLVNETIPSLKKAGRCCALLNIIDELHALAFMKPAAMDLYMKQGAICESMREYSLGIDYYAKGITSYATMIDPDEQSGYWLFNNNAFCHDFEMMFHEAQRLADKAIALDRDRHNAWKNRGVSLEHQDKYVEAAACYLASYIKCGGGDDPRPMMHFKRILRRHDGLRDDLAKQAKKVIGDIFPGSLASFGMAETYYHCGYHNKAIAEYRKFYATAAYGYPNHLKYAKRQIKDLKELKRLEKQLITKETL